MLHIFFYVLDSERALCEWQEKTRSKRRQVDFRIQFLSTVTRVRRAASDLRISWSGSGEIIHKKAIKTYFDLICRDGLITAAIGEYLGLRKEHIFGGDAEDPGNESITFVRTNAEQSTIDLGNDGFKKD